MSYTYFKLSKKSNYAIRALFELALRDAYEPINVRILATAQDIPVRFLEIILNELKQGGFVISVRGKAGGYKLAKPADAISVGEVIRFLEKTEVSGPAPYEQQRPGEFVFKRMMDEVNQRVSDVCDNTTLEEMVMEYKNNQEVMASNYII